MTDQTNTSLAGLRARLHQPGQLYTALMMLPEPAVASILGQSGLDYVMLDAEHGPYTLTSMRACVEALQRTPASAVIRTASGDSVAIQQMLDLGVDGVLVPRVGSADEAAAVVRATRYPTEGTRGIGGLTRASRYGADGDYVQMANFRTAAMAIIETEAGVANAYEIAAVPGLDGIMVGTTDLSAELGVPGQVDHPRVRDAIDTVLAAAHAAGIKAGPHPDGLNYCFTDVSGLASAVNAAVQHARDRPRSSEQHSMMSEDDSAT
jgi:4-hydroxy-2-oxoheptanedioate aldolase